jgi:adenine-specific DNA-methyltransferase
MYEVEHLGQVFTPQFVVSQMLSLRRNFGSILEPSSGDGAFVKNIPDCTGIEIDSKCLDVTPYGERCINMDFFDYSTENKFDTVIGNPPYVRFQDISPQTKQKLKSKLFDKRTNLYLFFIEKSIYHLNVGGELIFITPRDFLKATSSTKLNEFIYKNGTVTDIIELGDKKIFAGFSPNCLIWRFEKDNFSRKTKVYSNVSKGYDTQEFSCYKGQIFFTDEHFGAIPYSIKFSDVFFVKVGAVSGNDRIFLDEKYGNTDFVCSSTRKTGKTRKMIYNNKNERLEKHKDVLIKRKICKFDETNWWRWGRNHFLSERKRIYVNVKTRNTKPFFVHDCKNYDGSVLAIFPNNQNADVNILCEKLNSINWMDLGFICDGRYLFSQKSLQNAILPDCFCEDKF